MPSNLECRKPILDDIGNRFLRSFLPNLPYRALQEPQVGRFCNHIESDSLEKMYARRIASKKVVTDAREDVELALVSKIHPYLSVTPYEAMVQYFGNPSIKTPADFDDIFLPLGQDFLKFVINTTQAMLKIDQKVIKKPVISINVAPYARFTGHPKMVQSLAAPHAHIIAYTEEEANQMELIQHFTDPAERRVFKGPTGALNNLYTTIVNQLLRPFISDINIDCDPSEIINFTIDNLKDITDLEFLKKIILFEKRLSYIYRNLVSIFVKNPEEITVMKKDPKPLMLLTKEKQKKSLEEFVYANKRELSESAIAQLRRAVVLSQIFLSRHTIDNSVLLRGYAYSLIARPTDWNNVDGSWKVSLPLWLYGGGGVEGLGINKVRPKDTESAENIPLLATYLKSTERRANFNEKLIFNLQEIDPMVTIV